MKTLFEVVITELDEIKNKFGDERRTELSNQEANIDDESLIPEEEIIVSITKKGYVKRMSPDEFRTQKRGGKGVKGMKTNEDDLVDILVTPKPTPISCSLQTQVRFTGSAVIKFQNN